MMRLNFEARHKFAVGLAMVFLIFNFWKFSSTPFFLPFIAVAAVAAILPFFMDVMSENRKQKELETRFPEFVRNLTGAIKSGMPAASAVIHVSDTDYGSLSDFVRKLANQIEWAIPFHVAFQNFGNETNNPIIKRAIATVVQAEQAGGNLEDVLASITTSLLQIKKIKEERKASISSQIMQSYIIFFVFLGVMVVIQNLLIPYMSGLGGGGLGGAAEKSGPAMAIETSVAISFASPQAFISTLGRWFISLYGLFLMIALIQGFFAGIVLGKLAENDMTSGLKHSLVMVFVSFVVITFAQSIAK